MKPLNEELFVITVNLANTPQDRREVSVGKTKGEMC